MGKLKSYTIAEMQKAGFGYAWHNIRVMYNPETNRCIYYLNESVIIDHRMEAYYIHAHAGIEKASKEEAYLYWLSLGGAEWE